MEPEKSGRSVWHFIKIRIAAPLFFLIQNQKAMHTCLLKLFLLLDHFLAVKMYHFIVLGFFFLTSVFIPKFIGPLVG